MLTRTVDTVFGSALSPLSVNMILFTVTGAISPVIVNVYTNGSVFTNGTHVPDHTNCNGHHVPGLDVNERSFCTVNVTSIYRSISIP